MARVYTDAMTRMRIRQVAAVLVCGVIVCCARDSTITRGADGDSHWRRRISAADPVGTSLDDARVTMEANGFKCETISSGAEALGCEKTSAARLGVVRRQWQAWFAAADGRVTAVRSATTLLRQ